MIINSLEKLCHLLGLPRLVEKQIRGFSIDSRTVQEGEVFCAITGARHDGHHHIQEAVERGASAVLVERPVDCKAPVLIVQNVEKALKLTAAYTYRAAKVKGIAVTGSNGKTTTKEFIAQLLEGAFKTPGNANSQLGLPLSLLNGLTGQESYAVLEMGMSKAGEITSLVHIAPPHVALINSVSFCHAENFNGLKEIALAKAEIFSHPATPHKLFHRPVEDLIFECLAGAIPFELNARGLPFTLLLEGSSYYFYHGNRKWRLDDLPFKEEHLLHNLLAALSAICIAGIDLEKVLPKLAYLKIPEKRFQQVQKQGVLYVNDAYNASPESMKAALKALPKPAGVGKRVGVLGSMMELGKFSENCHREIGRFSIPHLDHLICYGEECRPIVEEWKKAGKEVYMADDFRDLQCKLEKLVKRDDVVLLKGSNSKQLWKLVEE